MASSSPLASALIGLALLAAGCGAKDDPGNGWFTFWRHFEPRGYILADRNGHFEAVKVDAKAVRKGELTEAQRRSLEQTLGPDRLVTYLATDQHAVEGCFQTGYTLSSGGSTGCWLPDKVQEPLTQAMLRELAQLLDSSSP